MHISFYFSIFEIHNEAYRNGVSSRKKERKKEMTISWYDERRRK
jgi:hypothetical protein